MVTLTPAEEDYLKAANGCRLATASRDGMPHVVPVRFAWDGQLIYITTDYGTKKLRNLEKNPKAAILVDDVSHRSGLLLQGEAEIIKGGPEFFAAQQVLVDRGAMRRVRQEGEEAVIRIRPTKAVSWRINP